ncbi:MAG: PilN domain-containing protein [Proteobacteria bacterium]|nr:PilN domain-containing protein [Pseudomonadota bacterium]
MIKINLLPVRAAAKRENLRKQLSIAVLSLVVCLLVSGYFYYRISGQVETASAEIAKTQKELNRLKSVIAKVNKFKKDSKVLGQKLKVIENLNRGRQSTVYFMDELSNMMPEELWLNSLQENKWALNIKGQSLAQSTIAAFMTNMENSRMFESVRWKSTQSKKEKDEALTIHSFVLDVRFVPPTK